jgi:hypothetical protein
MTKYKLMVCPHDTAKNPERWFLFALHLGKITNSTISFKSSVDFKEFHEKLTSSDLIYANPQDSLQLYKEKNYIPLAHPGGLYDEVVFIANKNVEHKSVQSINNQSVASVRSMMPTCLAVEHLLKEGVKPSVVTNKDSWMGVIKSVYKGDIPYGFVYRDFYESLNTLTRDAVEVIDVTNNKKIFHMFMLSPEYSEHVEQFSHALLNYHNDPKGNEILAQLNMSQLRKVDLQALDDLEDLAEVLKNYKKDCEEELVDVHVPADSAESCQQG